MEKGLLIFLLVCSTICGAQIVPSSCTANDTISNWYKGDAYRLAIQRIRANSYSYIDSISIPSSYPDTFSRALLAVYNDTTSIERDTVCTIFSMHNPCIIPINTLQIAADSSLPWMVQLQYGTIPTGNASVDSLIIPYGFVHLNYYSYGNGVGIVTLASDTYYNIYPLVHKWSAIQGITQAVPLGGCGMLYPYDIEDSLGTGFVDLIYNYNFGDCFNGCMFHRYWRFRVYSYCSVQFLGSYGDPITNDRVGILDVNSMKSFKISPNPATDKLTISTSLSDLDVTAFDMSGREFIVPHSQREIDISSLPAGVYCLRLQDTSGSIVRRFVKE